MKNFTMVLILICTHWVVRAGDDFALRFLPHRATIPQGIPVRLFTEVKNVSSHPISIDPIEFSSHYRIMVKRLDGSPSWKCSMPDKSANWNIPEAYQVMAPNGWTMRAAHEPSCIVEPGEYAVSVILIVRRPDWIEKPNFKQNELPTWKGEVASDETIIKVVAPKDEEDRLAFAAFWQLERDSVEIWGKHPTSIYAGYALTGEDNYTLDSLGMWMFSWNQNDKNQKIETKANGLLLGERHDYYKTYEERDQLVSDPKYHDRRIEIGTTFYQSFIASAEIFLKSHPDFEEAEKVRIRMMVALGILDRNKEAGQQLAILAQGDTPRAAEAKQLLAAWKE